MKGEELAKKREEAERKARRGEIDPMQEFSFQVIGQVCCEINLNYWCSHK